jgi:hypothetical protein
MNFDPKQETQEEYLRRVSLKDKINEEWKIHDQEKEEEIIIFKKDYQKK